MNTRACILHTLHITHSITCFGFCPCTQDAPIRKQDFKICFTGVKGEEREKEVSKVTLLLVLL